jgi:hypothetical protein
MVPGTLCPAVPIPAYAEEVGAPGVTQFRAGWKEQNREKEDGAGLSGAISAPIAFLAGSLLC